MGVVLAAFASGSEETAIFVLAGVACFIMAAFVSPVAGRFPGGSLGLIALGLALTFWSGMWQQLEAAF